MIDRSDGRGGRALDLGAKDCEFESRLGINTVPQSQPSIGRLILRPGPYIQL